MQQRSYVGEDGHLPLSEQRLQLRQRGMQAEGHAKIDGQDRQQRCLGDIDRGGGRARRGVLAVTGSIDGYQSVVAVVTAEHEHADQRLVVVRLLRIGTGDEAE